MIFGRFRKRKAEPEIEEVLPPEQEAEQIAKEIKADSAAEKEQVDIKDKKQRIDYIQRLYEGIQEAKNQNEQIKKEFVLFVQVDRLQCFDEVPICQMRYGLAVYGLYAILSLQGVCYARFLYFANIETLCTAEDSGQYHLGSFGYQKKYRFFRRLFQ